MSKRNLIILYGKPGVGKFTIAKELNVLTKFPLLHNHLTNDLVYSVFSREHPQGSILKQKFRIDLIDAWFEFGDSSLITTLIYKKNENEKYFIEMNEVSQKYGVTPIYIHLYCDEVENQKRVESEDRKDFDKITNWDDALKKMQQNNMNESVPFENNFEIDTTKLSVSQVAEKIIEFL